MSLQSKKPSDKKIKPTMCEECAYYTYDEEYDYYSCEMDLDEDEAYRFMTSATFACPYYRNGDEYAVVRHQI